MNTDEAVAAVEVEALTFEAALNHLEAVVRELEAGNTSLDRILALYTLGTRLRERCRTQLDAAEALIEKLVDGADGEPDVEVQP